MLTEGGQAGRREWVGRAENTGEMSRELGTHWVVSCLVLFYMPRHPLSYVSCLFALWLNRVLCQFHMWIKCSAGQINCDVLAGPVKHSWVSRILTHADQYCTLPRLPHGHVGDVYAINWHLALAGLTALTPVLRRPAYAVISRCLQTK